MGWSSLEKRREYIAKNADRIRELQRARYRKLRKENPEKLKAQSPQRFATYRAKHREKINQYAVDYRKAKGKSEMLRIWRESRERNIDKIQDAYFRKNYGISLEDRNNLIAKQKGLCAICGCKPPKLHLDHCHKTNVIRGMLCPQCNQALGMFREDAAILDAAKAYVLKHRVSLTA